MFQSPIRPNRIALGTMIAVAVASSCLGIVRAARFGMLPDGGTYTCSKGTACVEGNSTGKPFGVYGRSSGGNGVEGQSSAAAHAGVSGQQTGSSGIGVYAESHDTTGKYAALFARGDESTTNIFYGENDVTHASCLIDPNSDLSCKGSIDASPSTKSVAVMGNSGKDYGVEGVSTSADGVHGVTNSTTGSSGVAGIANGSSGSSYGVYGSSSTGPGVYGGSPQYGVEGVSTRGDGVIGITASSANGSAVEGVAKGASGSAYGVYGTSSNGYGVYGTTTTSSESAGVYGTVSSGSYGAGVEGVTGSSGYAGVLGVDTIGGNAVYGQSQNGTAIYATLGSKTSNGFAFFGSTTGGYCEEDPGANFYCTGNIEGGQALEHRHRTSTGHHVLSYASESTSAIIEDFGTARIVRGSGNVEIEPTFASTIDRNSSYYVFLTPLGDTRGLYVSDKTPSGFQVRETEGGHSTLSFDYRIVAHPADAGNGRLPPAPVVKTPRAPHLDAHR